MRTARLLAVAGVAALVLAGCAGGPGQDSGDLVGNAFAPGSAQAATNGAVVDGLVDNVIGRKLNDADKKMAANAEFRALEYGKTGTPVAWRGRDGAYGEVVPGASYQVNAYDCREFTHTIYVDGEPQVARGTACRQEDGSWRTVA